MATTSLPEALAELQASLPKVGKGKTAKVKTKTGGDYSYDYADLASISTKILPKLSALGLSFIAKPTMNGGEFGLAYSLLHVSGEREDGLYPLPARGTPQEIGSAITYARRYCLCAVTGVAPDGEDDDGHAAESAARSGQERRSQPAPPRHQDEQRREHNALRRGADGRLPKDEAARVRRCSPGNPCNEADCPHCTPQADLWAEEDAPAPPPLRTPRPAQSPASKIRLYLERFGYTDRDVRLGITRQLAEREERLSSGNDLTRAQAQKVLAVLAGCRDREALDEHLSSNQEVLTDA